ncbi:MAG TPA: hypothetical protein VHO70_11620 [Chitinispirillaceae bacterium]|nr:hypothetical protein [Chitinispirillaceae bacterium]
MGAGGIRPAKIRETAGIIIVKKTKKDAKKNSEIEFISKEKGTFLSNIITDVKIIIITKTPNKTAAI